MTKLKSFTVGMLGTMAVLLFLGAVFMPFLAAELYGLERQSKPLTTEVINSGSLVDEHWLVVPLTDGVFAIGEPQYYQANWNYLLIGSERALLFDAGSGVKDISKVVKRLTNKPVSVLVSHLHFDHVGSINAFDNVTMIDLPSVRDQMREDELHISRYQSLAFVDGRKPSIIKVKNWIDPDGTIDLGGRPLQVLSAPGHTPESIVLFDVVSKTLFTGDFIYPGRLFAMLPQSSRSAYIKSASRLLSHLPSDVIVRGAHASENNSAEVPLQKMSDITVLRDKLTAAEAGDDEFEGTFPRVLPISEGVQLWTGFPWNNR